MALTTEEFEWALCELEKFILKYDLECVDNFRFADAADAEEVNRFEEASRMGCCGSYDGEEIHPNGKKILIGCNYGH